MPAVASISGTSGEIDVVPVGMNAYRVSLNSSARATLDGAQSTLSQLQTLVASLQAQVKAMQSMIQKAPSMQVVTSAVNPPLAVITGPGLCFGTGPCDGLMWKKVSSGTGSDWAGM